MRSEPILAALAYVASRADAELRGAELVADRLTDAETAELIAIVDKQKALFREEPDAEPVTDEEKCEVRGPCRQARRQRGHVPARVSSRRARKPRSSSRATCALHPASPVVQSSSPMTQLHSSVACTEDARAEWLVRSRTRGGRGRDQARTTGTGAPGGEALTAVAAITASGMNVRARDVPVGAVVRLDGDVYGDLSRRPPRCGRHHQDRERPAHPWTRPSPRKDEGFP
jgi:hypothetical protein